ncbi:hypothetical protein L4C34_01630 [Vibrio profundum]|uniref:hypothetical protein n=1 Tax=Vibrio profundum TaxID=2910247 RepID=UPI003D149CB2
MTFLMPDEATTPNQSGIPELMSNGMSNTCLKQAVGFHLHTIRYPGIDSCISITIGFETGMVGLHLFRMTMENTLEEAVEQLKSESSKCTGQITQILIAGNIEKWMSKCPFHNYSLSGDTSKNVQALLMEKFDVAGGLITTTQIRSDVEVMMQKGQLSAANYETDD